TTSTNVGLGNTLDALGNNATGQLAMVMTDLLLRTSEERTLALKRMAPETSQALGQSAVNTSVAALDTVQVRLDSVRTGVGMNNAAHYDADVDDKDAAATKLKATNLASWDGHGSDAEGMSAGNDFLNRNLWLKAFGGKASHDAKNGFAGSDDSIYGTMLGYDTGIGGWLVGAAFGYARTNVKLDDYRSGDGADIDTYQLTGYFGRSFGSWYLNGMFTYAAQDYRTNRNTHMTGVAMGDFNGDLYGLRVLAGMPIAMRSGFTVTPYGGIEVNYIKQDAYTETGAGALSLNVASNAVYRVRSMFGAEVSTLKKLDNGTVIHPSVKLNWRHEFNDDGVNTTTSLVGGGGQFETIGQVINRDVYGLSARLTWERTEAMNVSFELGTEGGSGYSSYSGQVMTDWRF
ncbi:MAG TPA: autotransporter outer membrane beta-barrel domain-containing protein, partial [Burkholderiales bacterium]|nr:autotransporter outer membrane beta-barrel domain-containing protein [Burkholderiales bacterium]